MSDDGWCELDGSRETVTSTDENEFNWVDLGPPESRRGSPESGEGRRWLVMAGEGHTVIGLWLGQAELQLAGTEVVGETISIVPLQLVTSKFSREECCNDNEIGVEVRQGETKDNETTNSETSIGNSKVSDVLKLDYIHVRARCGQATNSHSLAERITDFCNDLKKLATRAKVSENTERGYGKKSPVVVKKWKEKECDGENIGELDKRGSHCLRRAEEAENIPISLDVKNVNNKEGDFLWQIRTCPPSPQYFSVGCAPSKATPLKASRSRPPEKRILGELNRCNTELLKEEAVDNNNCGRTASIVAKRERRTLDVFWFLKPCTLSSYS
ncbi:hypothetical protein RHSIM_Rhsim07G0166600 [Rhododendron simsii]|uniref:Uncharacterized protein n=1 Tax=Rhododendron simsii TaxID=118357 RepID=A0A834GRL3_RHOSS|nr:hypothetical protein RHSIM_Rhsim07G0166600 [Rhododendron simsii]